MKGIHRKATSTETLRSEGSVTDNFRWVRSSLHRVIGQLAFVVEQFAKPGYRFISCSPRLQCCGRRLELEAPRNLIVEFSRGGPRDRGSQTYRMDDRGTRCHGKASVSTALISRDSTSHQWGISKLGDLVDARPARRPLLTLQIVGPLMNAEGAIQNEARARQGGRSLVLISNGLRRISDQPSQRHHITEGSRTFRSGSGCNRRRCPL